MNAILVGPEFSLAFVKGWNVEDGDMSTSEGLHQLIDDFLLSYDRLRL